MLKNRIIPCLDIKNGRTVKGIKFEALKDAGDPVELAKFYEQSGADELVFLDITASQENRNLLLELIEKIAEVISIPFTVGGGIKSLEDADRIINAGADKLSINSSALIRPMLIQEISNRFGKQCVVVAVDVKKVGTNWKVFSHGGKIETDYEIFEWLEIIEKLGAGELLLTSMDADGTKAGFDLELLKLAASHVTIPVIASGGAGKIDDFEQLFQSTRVTGALAASVFHYKEIEIRTLKNQLKQSKIAIR